ncbi:MAG: SPOR domain-containing protein [Deltaproteobacteria bacterium]|nr:SPOR domain-containing protein [Deltaproteobacteria bacterium]
MKNSDKTSKIIKPLVETGRRGTVVWICIIAFVSVWMFVLGIFVGRGTAPVKFDIEKLQKELIALKEAVLKEEKKQFKLDPDTGTGKIELSFYEALKDTKKNVRSSGTSPEKKKQPEKEVDVRPSPQLIKTASTGQAKTGDGFTIQVASLKDSKAADEITKQLKAKGYPAYTIMAKIPEKGIWYRVRTGEFKNKSETGDMLSRLKKNKFKPIVVQK